MNTSSSFRLTAFAAAALASLAIGQTASAQGFSGGVFVAAGDVDGDGAYRGGVTIAVGDVNYVGRDGNWFNPANWSSGRVPGAEDRVVLDGDDYVVIDAAQGSVNRRAPKEILVVGSATLEVIGGETLDTASQVLAGRGQIIFRASGDIGESLVVAPGSGAVKLVQNPNPKSKRFIVLQSSTSTNMGLGGETPASVSRDAAGGYRLAAGPGHYATMTVDTLVIDGELSLSTYYDFRPRPGQTFQIATVNGRRTGEFIGIPEGGYVGCTDENVGLRLSYEGGDGNDIVISAEQTDPGVCLLLPAVQKVREAAARVNVQARIDKLPLAAAVEEGVTQTREHILLARQTQLSQLPSGGQAEFKMPAPTTPISGPKPTPK